MQNIAPSSNFIRLMRAGTPDASAYIKGNQTHPGLAGTVHFYSTSYGGVLVVAEIFGLPNITEPGSVDFYGFHIHEHGNCTLPYDKTGDHYNPTGEEHPSHAGDLPPLMGNQGYAFSVFYDKNFQVPDIIGRSVIIHSKPDDFTTQPSGNSGEKIACGVIR